MIKALCTIKSEYVRNKTNLPVSQMNNVLRLSKGFTCINMARKKRLSSNHITNTL